MKTLHHILQGTAVLAFTTLCTPADLQAGTPQHIEVRGRVLLDGTTAEDAMLTIVMDNACNLPFELQANGRFKVLLPVNSQFTIRFEKPGYLSKDVVVDTHYALCSTTARKANHIVRFDVQMQPMPAVACAYAGPVGCISFIKGSGLMKVRYDRTLTDLLPAWDVALFPGGK